MGELSTGRVFNRGLPSLVVILVTIAILNIPFIQAGHPLLFQEGLHPHDAQPSSRGKILMAPITLLLAWAELLGLNMGIGIYKLSRLNLKS